MRLMGLAIMSLIWRAVCGESRKHGSEGARDGRPSCATLQECGRQFVSNPQQILISSAKRQRIRKLLMERIPLRGICRTEDVSLRWLLAFMVDLYGQLPDDLNFGVKAEAEEYLICTFESEIDEMQSFVGKKANKQWIWIAMDRGSRQIVAFHVSDRSRISAKALWKSIPEFYRQHARFYTDGWQAYVGVIPAKQHRVVKKQNRITNHIERFNCTLRQRVSRLVRQSLSFSKKLANHIGAIKYFICHYNLQKALHV